jgi:hypothetical protein
VPQLREFLSQVNLGVQSGFLNLDVLDLESVTLAPLDALCKPAANHYGSSVHIEGGLVLRFRSMSSYRHT